MTISWPWFFLPRRIRDDIDRRIDLTEKVNRKVSINLPFGVVLSFVISAEKVED